MYLVFFLISTNLLNGQVVDTIYYKNVTVEFGTHPITKDTIETHAGIIYNIQNKKTKIYLKNLFIINNNIQSEGILIKKERCFRKDLSIRVGYCKTYHSNGNLWAEGYYDNKGEKIYGTWIYYDRNGIKLE